jgi:hypothetical protein
MGNAAKRPVRRSEVTVRVGGIEIVGQGDGPEAALRDVLHQAEERVTLTPAGWAAAYRAKGAAGWLPRR